VAEPVTGSARPTSLKGVGKTITAEAFDVLADSGGDVTPYLD